MDCHWMYAIGVILVGVGGCAVQPDVDVAGPTLALDATNPVLPTLSKQVCANPKANTFRVSWSVTPDPKRPLESIPHWLLYNRKTKVLSVHLDRTYYHRYSGVTASAIQRLASRKGSTEELCKMGCVYQVLTEP